mmetsp:Transcript_29918/g.85681  ORF Transcript_29918/g.85681 Transcript_29918/m.85681 type:complete len:121 (-) Transcript_29918:177-539(-)
MADLISLAKGDSKNQWQLVSPKTVADMRVALRNYVQRAGGAKQATGAILVGATVSAACLRDLPYVPAALLGASSSAYAVQLPKDNRIGEAAREAGRGAASFWDFVTGGSWQHAQHQKRNR